MFDIKDELNKLPNMPGVYLMKDADDKIIYVGKAIVLKNRVRQYFQKTNKTVRIQKMVSLINSFEYIVTTNEKEALILECNLIKKHRPKFNVLLKDDKTYPFIKITLSEKYPKVFLTRRNENDGSKYFGPYTNVLYAKEILEFIKENFNIVRCSNYKKHKQVCLYYHMHKCFGPCVYEVDQSKYLEQIREIILLLEGKLNINKVLENKIATLSAELKFEEAAKVRDKLSAIKGVTEKQSIANINEKSVDVIGYFANDDKVCIEVFFIRKNKIVGREHYFFNLDNNSTLDVINDFVKQYYINNIEDNIPNKIMIRDLLDDMELLRDTLHDKFNKNVEIKIPKIGEKLRFIEMAETNAKITLENKLKSYDKNTVVLQSLKDALKLDVLPKRIETFDISHIGGTNIVGAMVAAINGKIEKRSKRLFKIKTVNYNNDYECTKEVLERRIARTTEKHDEAFGDLPDLILADGGKSQISAIKAALTKYGVNIPVFGMVKDSRHNTAAIIDESDFHYELSEELFKFVSLFQDEVHNTAINYHKKLRSKSMIKGKE
jgi:excinuclease ABC subunit C